MSIVARILINGIIGIVTAVVLAVLALVVYQIGPYVERLYFPVLTDFKVVTVKPLDNKIAFRFSYVKQRDCRLMSVSWFRNDGIIFGPAYVSTAGDGPLAVRTPGPQISVWWQIADPILAGEYQAVFTYDCGLPWVTQTSLGPVEIKLP